MRLARFSNGAMKTRTVLLVSVATLALAAVVACGGAGGTSAGAAPAASSATAPTAAPAQPAPAAATASQQLTVELKEWAFEPKDIIVRPGTITFTLKNVGERRHNMVIEVGGQKLKSADISAGQSGTFEVTLTAPGKYVIYCDLQNHRERGMEGTLTVQG
jgi:plastocyanin